MKPLVLSAALVLVTGAPAWAQSTMPAMPGMQHPASPQPPPPPPPAPGRQRPAPQAPAAETPAPPTPAVAESARDGESMPGMAMEETVGNEPPPPAPSDYAADRVFDPAVMQAAREQLQRDHGGAIISAVMVDLAELQFSDDETVFRWEGEGWIGGDINRFVLKTEGEANEDDVESAEVQALYSRAIGPYFDLQAGVRYDIEPSPNRAYAVFGFEGVAPYWFETTGALFVSEEGEFSARLEGAYDVRLTQRFILQPRAEIDLSADDIPERGVGAGFTDAEVGLRLRYDITRTFAPYVGVSYETKLGDTADYASAAGEEKSDTRLVLGVRARF